MFYTRYIKLFLSMVLALSTYADDVVDKVSSSPDADKKLTNILDSLKNVGTGVKNFWKGTEQSFGKLGPEYKYNFIIFNDTPLPIQVDDKKIVEVLGAEFKSNVRKKLIINPFENSGREFMDRSLFLMVVMHGNAAILPAVIKTLKTPEAFKENQKLIQQTQGLFNKFFERAIYPWQPNDTNTYYYRAYTNKGALKGEYLDVKETTSAFAGQFYNNSKRDVVLAFTKDAMQYAVTLESNSFNVLESSPDVNYSIRPPAGQSRGFQLYQGSAQKGNELFYIPIQEKGIANAVNISQDEKNPRFVAGEPMFYSYEIYEGKDGLAFGLQGLSIGTYDQPIGRVRDINPVTCHVWFQSAEQMKKMLQKNGVQQTYETMNYDTTDQVWISYKTKDFSAQKKITPGSITNITLIRPQIAEKKAWLYIVACQTNDDKKAQQFLDRLAAGTIGQSAVYTDMSDPLDKQDVMKLEPNLNGIINDSAGSGITGIVLSADAFLARGVGSGPFYYSIAPNLLRVDQFANVIWFNQKAYKKDQEGNLVLDQSILENLAQNLPQWITQYKKNKDAARKLLIAYMQEHGNDGLFVDATRSITQRVLNDQGNELVETLLTGPISLQYPPLMPRAGTNYFAYTLGAKPDNWPSA